jgi:hypothetical protein
MLARWRRKYRPKHDKTKQEFAHRYMPSYAVDPTKPQGGPILLPLL